MALYWLQAAAAQGDADAMHWLGTACVQADPPDHDRAMMWIARAAAHGHVIARQQLDAMLAAVVPGSDRR